MAAPPRDIVAPTRDARAVAFGRAGNLLPVVGFLSSIGAPVEPAWRRAGLPPRALHQPDALVPSNAGLRFLESVARQQGIPTLGWLAARRSGIEGVGVFGRALRRSFTLFDALDTAGRLVAANNSGARYWLAFQGDEVAYCRRSGTNVEGSLQGDIQSLEMSIELVAAAAGPSWRPSRIEVQSSAPGLRIDDPVLEGVRIETGARATAIVFPRVLLGKVLARPAGASPLSADEARDWVANGPPERFAESARLLVRLQLEAGRARIEEVADAAGLSRRTFQRRLGEAGLSHSRLVDEARFARAVELLEDADRKTIDVAYEVGYSDPAHFTRAFRRWSSLAPSDFRRLLRRGEEQRL